MSGSVQERTFQYQSILPPLPVPSLEMTLSKYLDAGRISVFCVIIRQLNVQTAGSKLAFVHFFGFPPDSSSFCFREGI